MWNWLVRLWQKIDHWFHREETPQSYHRSNLHGRHR